MDKLHFKVWDKTEKREKFVVSLEWNMDNPQELIEVHTWPIAIYKGGYRLRAARYLPRDIDELELLPDPPDRVQPDGGAEG